MRRQALYGADPEETFVSVYCNDSSHPEKRWLLATYYPQPDAGEGYWSEHRGKYQSPTNEYLIPLSGSTRTFLAGDRPISREEARNDPDVLEQGDSRARFTLKCRLCPESVAMRADKAFPVFDILASASVREISLASLRERLSK